MPLPYVRIWIAGWPWEQRTPQYQLIPGCKKLSNMSVLHLSVDISVEQVALNKWNVTLFLISVCIMFSDTTQRILRLWSAMLKLRQEKTLMTWKPILLFSNCEFLKSVRHSCLLLQVQLVLVPSSSVSTITLHLCMYQMFLSKVTFKKGVNIQTTAQFKNPTNFYKFILLTGNWQKMNVQESEMH